MAALQQSTRWLVGCRHEGKKQKQHLREKASVLITLVGGRIEFAAAKGWMVHHKRVYRILLME
jgi:hypothetical protein